MTPAQSVVSFSLQCHMTIFANVCNICILLLPPYVFPSFILLVRLSERRKYKADVAGLASFNGIQPDINSAPITNTS